MREANGVDELIEEACHSSPPLEERDSFCARVEGKQLDQEC
jgi:hypothetical protein